MRVLASEQINLNLSNKFVKTYIQKQKQKQKQKKKKKKEAEISFHQLLENEQNRLEE